MMIEIKIVASSDEAELQKVLAVLGAGVRNLETREGNAQPAAEEPPKRRGRPAKTEATGAGTTEATSTKPAETEPTPEVEPETVENEETIPAAKQVIDAGTGQPVADREAVKKRAMGIVASPGGKETLTGLFSKYGVARLSELPDDKLAAFAQDVEAVLSV